MSGARKPIGYVLRCEDSKLGVWYDFRDGPNPPAGEGWFPVVPQVDPLLESMHSVLWNGHDRMWDARAQGCTAWAKAATVWDAVGLAHTIAQPQPEPEDPLW